MIFLSLKAVSIYWDLHGNIYLIITWIPEYKWLVCKSSIDNRSDHGYFWSQWPCHEYKICQ